MTSETGWAASTATGSGSGSWTESGCAWQQPRME
ncbi:hypothetical protein M2158_009950 [Streptomyces sp. SAI-144]|nr:hypothetical protein [Streptomyces sp. SAI-144]